MQSRHGGSQYFWLFMILEQKQIDVAVISEVFLFPTLLGK